MATLRSSQKENTFYIPLNEEMKEIVCSICRSAFKNPVKCSCGHTYCRSCIIVWLSHNESCPICRKKTDVSDLKSMLFDTRNTGKFIISYPDNDEERDETVLEVLNPSLPNSQIYGPDRRIKKIYQLSIQNSENYINQIKDLQEASEISKDVIEDLCNQLENYEKNASKIKSELESVKGAAAILKSEREIYKNKEIEARKELQLVNNVNKALKNEVKLYQNEIEIYKNSELEIRKELDKEKINVEKLKNEIEKLKNTENLVEEQLKTEININNNQRTELEIYKNRIKIYKNELEVYENEMMIYENKINEKEDMAHDKILQSTMPLYISIIACIVFPSVFGILRAFI
ncbi:RING finger protein 219-like [Centruroides sculpturatus]|uniref:RING finger protein 219-like n=1 Tax=Centruroides sculpturatus TaxID=218467 RepID=UPI000C6D298D|nr:RING finger protein 219-like [Centruroides sculpturatus]